MTTWQDDVFIERLTRLEKKHAQRSDFFASGRNGGSRAQLRDIKFTLSLTASALIGFLSVILVRYAMFHSQGLPDPSTDPDLVMAVDAMFAFFIAYFWLRMIFSITSKFHVAAKILGISAALLSIDTLVQEYPEIWEHTFSEEWVAQTLRTNTPD